jgi:hypothetical protein
MTAGSAPGPEHGRIRWYMPSPALASGRDTPTLAGTIIGKYGQTLQAGLGGGREASSKMLRALRAWDVRPRYPELNRLQIPALVVGHGRARAHWAVTSARAARAATPPMLGHCHAGDREEGSVAGRSPPRQRARLEVFPTVLAEKSIRPFRPERPGVLAVACRPSRQQRTISCTQRVDYSASTTLCCRNRTRQPAACRLGGRGQV